MGILSIILLVLFVIVSLLLIFLIAVQDENSVGLGGIFGGNSDSAFGGRSSKFITKATAILATVFMVLALLVAVVNKGNSGDDLLNKVEVVQTESGTNWLESDGSQN